MRTALVLIIILVNSALVSGQVAEFSFDQKTHKFPKTLEGEVLRHHFRFSNTGDIPLIIESFKVSCPCTKVILPEKPILPGASDEIKVEFDTKDKIGWQDRTIELYSNAQTNPLKLRLKVMIENREKSKN